MENVRGAHAAVEAKTMNADEMSANYGMGYKMMKARLRAIRVFEFASNNHDSLSTHEAQSNHERAVLSAPNSHANSRIHLKIYEIHYDHMKNTENMFFLIYSDNSVSSILTSFLTRVPPA